MVPQSLRPEQKFRAGWEPAATQNSTHNETIETMSFPYITPKNAPAERAQQLQRNQPCGKRLTWGHQKKSPRSTVWAASPRRRFLISETCTSYSRDFIQTAIGGKILPVYSVSQAQNTICCTL